MLIAFTILCLCISSPLEAYASANRGGIITFGYLIDFLGMCLLAGGVVTARRKHQIGYALLDAGSAWTSANFWRATMERFWTLAGRAKRRSCAERTA